MPARRPTVHAGLCLSVSLSVAALSLLASPAVAATDIAPGAPPVPPLYLLGIPVDFILFALTLIGVAVLHHHTLPVALTGLAAITLYKLVFTGFKTGLGFAGLGLHLQHEWVILANLFLLLMGFALLSRHFEKSRVPDEMPAFLPDDWKGGFALLAIVFVLSSFLDNIAAALIGGTMARHVFKRVHIGYLAAIVAASNAGGSGSVVGDTTTTMMWIDGISPLKVVEAYVAAGLALLVFGIPAALQQHRYCPIVRDAPRGLQIEWTRLVIVMAILVIAILANVIANLRFPAVLDAIPVIGLAVWAVILATTPLRRPDWEIMPETFKGTIFLLALVTSASMMPVETLPLASWHRFRRIDDLVRLICRCRPVKHVSGSQIGRPMAAARMARGDRLRRRFLFHAGNPRLACRRGAQEARRGAGCSGRSGSCSVSVGTGDKALIV
jgi:hypothetical protein